MKVWSFVLVTAFFIYWFYSIAHAAPSDPVVEVANVPSQIIEYSEFEFSVKISGLDPSITYKYKISLKPDADSKGSGYVNNKSTGVWVSYATGSWDESPEFQPSQEGIWGEDIKVRSSVGKVGNTAVSIVLRKQGSASNWKTLPLFSANVQSKPEESGTDEEDEEINYPDNIKITEFMPCPKKDEEEWVELFNENEEEVELIDWKIDDKDGGSSPQLFSETIKKHNYVVVKLKSSKLNNSGDDEVRLLNPDGEEVDKTSYEGCITEYSYALDDEEFKLTSKTTPGDDNEFDEVEEEEVEENVKEDTVIMDENVQEAAVPKASLAEIPKTFEIQNVPEILGESTSVDSIVQEDKAVNDDLETIDPSGKLPIILLIPIPALFAILGVIIKRLL